MRNLEGLIFGSLKVLCKDDRPDSTRKKVWKCSCVKSGITRYVLESDLLTGKVTAISNHGLSEHPLYSTWSGMRMRCNNPNSIMYDNYGGRGIKVCERWDYFPNFVKDMGDRPSKNHTLDRINNNKNYEPSNCRWATDSEQRYNKRSTLKVNLNGKQYNTSELASLLKIDEVTIRRLIRNDYDAEKILLFYSGNIINEDNSKYIIGIDAGINGGVFVLKDGTPFLRASMPKDGNHIIFKRFINMLESFKNLNTTVVTEDLHAIWGVKASATFGLGRAYGGIVACCDIFDYKKVFVNPKVWQKDVWGDHERYTHKVKDKIRIDTKRVSLEVASKIFPKESWLASTRSFVPHDGIVDAALLAYYGHKNNF
jgi:hypothetical protein